MCFSHSGGEYFVVENEHYFDVENYFHSFTRTVFGKDTESELLDYEICFGEVWDIADIISPTITKILI